MGKDLLTTFSVARKVIAELDNALQSFVDCPPWSIAGELSVLYKHPSIISVNLLLRGADSISDP